MSKKILVLENTEGISELLNISLAYDYDVITASNGDEALRVIEDVTPPIVIFDIKVPDMDGIEFLCKIKKQHPQTEVITLADPDCMDVGVTSLRYEASDYILKPVTSMSLEIALERAEKKLAIKKRLAPSNADVFPSLVDTERSSVAKQMIGILSSSARSESDQDKDVIPGILSLHTRTGIILCTSDAHKKLFGNMEGKSSWEIFKRGDVSPETCPSALAFKNNSKQTQSLCVTTNKGDEFHVNVVAAPLFNHNDKTDLVLQIITL